MLAFAVEIDAVLTPRMQVGDEFELLTEPRMKRVSDSETPTQNARIRCS